MTTCLGLTVPVPLAGMSLRSLDSPAASCAALPNRYRQADRLNIAEPFEMSVFFW